MAWQAGLGKTRNAAIWMGRCGMARSVSARLGGLGLGVAGQARLGRVRLDTVVFVPMRFGRHGVVCSGAAGYG